MTDIADSDTYERPLRKGEQARVRIEGLTQDGRGIARVGGKVLFVSDALPGETVDATMIRRRRGHDEARLDTIIVASDDRTEPVCEWFGRCGGCSLQHLSGDSQLALKQQWLLDALQRIGKVEAEEVLAPLTGPVSGYRRRARLGVKYVDAKQRVLVGFRERHKSYITDMGGCTVLVPEAAALILPLQELIGGLSIRRRLPQIEVAQGDDSTVLVFRVLDPPDNEDLARLREFSEEFGVTVALQPGNEDTVTGIDDGAPLLSYAHDEVQFRFSPTDFIQINGVINAKMVRQVIEQLEPRSTERVLDLFCGLGNFSLPLARHVEQVTGLEGSERLVRRARENALLNKIDNAVFEVSNLYSDPVPDLVTTARCDLMVLDPPRSGAQEICQVAGDIGARRIAYVSCHPATLARDAGILVHQAGYRLLSTGIMDMFPHTAHVESFAVFEKA